MSKVLIIVHVEPDFESGILENFPTVQRYLRRITKYSERFDKVINVSSTRSVGEGILYPQIAKFIEHEWVWGYWPDDNNEHEEGTDYIPVSTAHEYAFIEHWMRDLSKTDKYYLIGGARRECLQDVADIFSHLELKYKITESLTYAR